MIGYPSVLSGHDAHVRALPCADDMGFQPAKRLHERSDDGTTTEGGSPYRLASNEPTSLTTILRSGYAGLKHLGQPRRGPANSYAESFFCSLRRGC